METIRRNHRIVGAIALTLVCVAFLAAPASAHIGRGGFDQGTQEAPVASRFVVIITEFQDSFTAFMQRLGAIFAGQEGSQIVD